MFDLKELRAVADDTRGQPYWPKKIINDAASEIEFWKERAIWWCAHAENGLSGKPDAHDLTRAERIIVQERNQQ